MRDGVREPSRLGLLLGQGSWLRAAIGEGTGTVVVGNILARGLGLVFPILVAHLVDRDDFGLVYLFINTGFFVGEMVLTGFPTALTRQIAAAGREPRTRLEIPSAILAGLPLYAAAIVAAAVAGPAAAADPTLIAVVVTGLTIDAYYFAVLRGLRRFGLLAVYRVGANAVQVVLVLLAAALDVADVGSVVWIYSLVYLVPLVAIELTVGPTRRVLARVARPSWSGIRSLSAFALPALLSGVAYGFIVGLDVYVVRLVAAGALPEYAAARAITLPLTMVPYGIGVVLMPRVASAAADGRRLLRDAFALAAAFGIVAVIGYVVLAGPVVALLYPPTLGGAAGVAPVLAAAFAVLGTYSVLGSWWFGIGLPMVPAACLTIGALVAGAAHLVVTPGLGAPGAAISVGLGGLTAVALLGARTISWRDR